MPIRLDMTAGQPDAIAYEACLTAISPIITRVNNPLCDVVPPLWGDTREKVCSFPFLYSFVRRWCRPGAVLGGKNKDQVANIVMNYINAIRLAWDRLPPGAEKYYWAPPLNPIPSGVRKPDDEERGIISHTDAPRGDQSSWLKILFELFPAVYQLAGSPVPSIPQMEKVLARIKMATLVGNGWKDCIGATKDESYVTELFRDMINKSGKVAAEMKRLKLTYPDGLDSYIVLPPDVGQPRVKGLGPGGEIVPGAQLEYDVPFNCRGTVWIRIEQGGSAKRRRRNHHKGGRGTRQSYELVDDDFKVRGGQVDITIEAENPVARSISHPPLSLPS